VNIDGNPNSVAQFQAARPGDRNVHAVVSDEPVDVTFTIFRDGAISTADPTLRDQTLNSGRDKNQVRVTQKSRRLIMS
jgi:hypothetical protein